MIKVEDEVRVKKKKFNVIKIGNRKEVPMKVVLNCNLGLLMRMRMVNETNF